MGDGRIKILLDIASNTISNQKYNLSYVVEVANWSIKMDGRYITSSLNSQNLIRARITTTYLGLKNQIIHFGSIGTFLKKNDFQKPHSSSRLVLTWFHFVPGDKKNRNILPAQRSLDFIHTSCSKTRDDLISFGIDSQKIIVIPLGVDLTLFKPISLDKKQELKKRLGIPEDKIVIGSFQKDGIGWGKGLKPKLIKGPDIFAKTAERLAKKYPIFVLLVGPARGYLKKELIKRKVPFKDIGYLNQFRDISRYYQALDLYLITSRIEGGPKQILESWASGIPVVATRVGMIPDIAQDKESTLMTNIEDANGLVNKASQVIEDKELREKLTRNGLIQVADYSWDKIAQKYYQKIYSKLL